MKGVEPTPQVQKKSNKLFSIKGALDLIDHSPVMPHTLSEEQVAGMKLSKKEEEMQSAVRSKMRYAGETYHRVAPPEMDISK